MTLGVGFALGQEVPVNAPPPAEDPCAVVKQAFKDEWERPSATQDGFDEMKARTVGYLVVDNPECFSVGVRAQFKALLDGMNQRGAS